MPLGDLGHEALQVNGDACAAGLLSRAEVNELEQPSRPPSSCPQPARPAPSTTGPPPGSFPPLTPLQRARPAPLPVGGHQVSLQDWPPDSSRPIRLPHLEVHLGSARRRWVSIRPPTELDARGPLRAEKQKPRGKLVSERSCARGLVAGGGGRGGGGEGAKGWGSCGGKRALGGWGGQRGADLGPPVHVLVSSPQRLSCTLQA